MHHTDHSRNPNWPLQHPLKTNLARKSRNLRIPKLVLGLRLHVSNLPHRWYLRRPPQPSHQHHALRLPRIPTTPLCRVHLRADARGADAGGVAYGLYRDSILHAAAVSGVSREEVSSGALFTIPMPWVQPVTGFFTEFVGTGVLMCTILALGDHTNAPPGAGMQAFIVGLLIAIMCMALGYNTGG